MACVLCRVMSGREVEGATVVRIRKPRLLDVLWQRARTTDSEPLGILGLVHRPIFKKKKKIRKHNVSETGSVSVLKVRRRHSAGSVRKS
jgi:hypothetical protein